jgi:uncharacterized protein (DUF1800 family)
MKSPLEEARSATSEDEPSSPSSEEQRDTPQTENKSTRRQLFTLGAALAAATLVPGRKAEAQRIVRPHTTRPRAPEATGDSLLRLVRRATFGVTEEEYALAKSMGFARYLEYQLKPSSIDDSACDAVIGSRFPNLALDGTGLYQQDQIVLLNQLQEATLYRAAFSKRQLYERMVHFWTDHFSIYYLKVNYLKLLDDRDVIRKHALGKFPDLLRASAHSPAMLEYLDNTRSRARSVNQNYAREIMELHTLGVDGGYTQTDVEEVTRCLTGWTIQGRGEFRFDPSGHDFTAKTVLGQTIDAMPTSAGAAGQQDGETVLNMLVQHPSTAKFISKKMIRWLLQYDPPQTLIDKVAATYARTSGDIPSMIRDILTPANLLAAPFKYRQPYQLVAAALRATQPSTVINLASITNQMRTLGQSLFTWEDPDGFPDNVDWWAGTILLRWNYCGFLTGLSSGNLVVDVAPLMTVNTPDGIADAIGRRAFAGQMPAALRQQVVAHLAAAAITTTRVREAFALALSSNHYQWY